MIVMLKKILFETIEMAWRTVGLEIRKMEHFLNSEAARKGVHMDLKSKIRLIFEFSKHPFLKNPDAIWIIFSLASQSWPKVYL